MMITVEEEEEVVVLEMMIMVPVAAVGEADIETENAPGREEVRLWIMALRGR